MTVLVKRRHVSQLAKAASDELRAFIGVCTVIVILFTIGWTINYANDRYDASKNEKLLRSLYSYGAEAIDTSEEMKSRRQEVAKNFIDVSGEFDYFLKNTMSDDQMEAVTLTAETGLPSELDVTHSEYLKPFKSLEFWLWALLVFHTLAIIVSIYDHAYYSRTRLADLEWKRPATWLFVILTGPIGWLAMSVSFAGLLWDDRARSQAQDVPIDHWQPTPLDNRATESAHVITRTYQSSPNATVSTYVEMRSNGAHAYRQRRLDEFSSEIERCRNELREYGERIRTRQAELNKLQAERTKVEEATLGNEITRQLACEEFERILTLPGIFAVQSVNDRVRFVIRAQHVYDDTTYDLGDWQIDIGSDTLYIEAIELRSGVRSTWGDRYPVYRLGGDRFCFGERQGVINSHLRKAQYPEALALAVECLSGVNREDCYLIPDAFYPIKAEEDK